jgi:hypothetical protein
MPPAKVAADRPNPATSRVVETFLPENLGTAIARLRPTGQRSIQSGIILREMPDPNTQPPVAVPPRLGNVRIEKIGISLLLKLLLSTAIGKQSLGGIEMPRRFHPDKDGISQHQDSHLPSEQEDPLTENPRPLETNENLVPGGVLWERPSGNLN